MLAGETAIRVAGPAAEGATTTVVGRMSHTRRPVTSSVGAAAGQSDGRGYDLWYPATDLQTSG